MVGGVATGIITSVPFVLAWNGAAASRGGSTCGSRVIARIPDGSHALPSRVRFRRLRADGEPDCEHREAPIDWRLAISVTMAGCAIFDDTTSR